MSWDSYFAKNKGRALRDVYVRALPHLSAGSHQIAVDLGCGIGIEVADLVTRGWDVYGVDEESRAIESTRALLPEDASERFRPIVTRFEELKQLPDADLVLCYHSISFTRPDRFNYVWSLVRSALKSGGVVAGGLFGCDDEWSKTGRVVGVSIDQLKSMLDGFEVLYFKEARNSAFHSFDIIARNI